MGAIGDLWGQGSPQGSQLKFSKFRKKLFYLWIFGLRTTTTRYLGPIRTMLAPGTFWLGGQIRELEPPKESKSETPNLIAPRGDVGFWSYPAKKFFGPSSILWHTRNFPRGVPTPQNLAPKNNQFSALPQARFQCPHEKFSPHGIFRGYRRLSNGEEGV